MKAMKKSLAVLLALTMVMSMGMCSSAAEFDGTLKVGIPGDPEDLSLFTTMSVGKMYTLETIYEYLGVYECLGGEYVPWVAKEWTVSDDALTVDVEIYDYITDAVGNNITAEDVKWCYDTAVEAACSSSLGYLDSVEVTGDYTVRFNMSSAIVDGWQQVLSAIPVVSRETYEANEDSFTYAPITTSAYVVTEFTPGSSLKLETRDDYWQTDDSLLPIKHNVDAIDFEVINDSSQMSIALETGLIDIAEGLSTAEVERFMEGGESSEGFTTFSTLRNMTYSVLFNCSDNDGLFKDNKELRQAICYAIDADAILEGVLNGGGVKCMTWGPYNADDFDPSWVDSYYDYDPDKAIELIEESGWVQEEPIVMDCENDSIMSATLEMIQAYLDAVGIQSELNVVDSGLFDSIKYDDTEWDILLDNMGGKNLALVANSLNSVGKSYINVCFANDEELQDYCSRMVEVPTHTEELCEEWVNYINEEVFAYGLFAINFYVAAADFVDDVTITNRAALFPGNTVIAG